MDRQQTSAGLETQDDSEKDASRVYDAFYIKRQLSRALSLLEGGVWSEGGGVESAEDCIRRALDAVERMVSRG